MVDVDSEAYVHLTNALEGLPVAGAPAAGAQDYLELVVGAKALYASFAVTGKAEASAPGSASGSEAAFIGAMYSEMKEMEGGPVDFRWWPGGGPVVARRNARGRS